MSSSDLAFSAWREDANGTDIKTALALAAPGIKYRGTGELVGPCPRCGGNDRFSLKVKERIYNCRHCAIGTGARGPIDLVMRGLKKPFLTACELLTGRPAPNAAEMSEDERARIAQELADRHEQAKRTEREREEKAAALRARAQGWAQALWARGREDWLGSPIEAYLRDRGLGGVVDRHGVRLCLRWLPDLPFRPADAEGGSSEPLYTGPAMLLRGVDRSGFNIGCHRTWVQPGATPKHRPTILNHRGEAQPTKRVLGSKTGGLFVVIACRKAREMVVGEGLENTLDGFERLEADTALINPAATLVVTASDKGNLYGRAIGRTAATREIPDLESPCAFVPETVTRLWIVEDSDIQPWMTARFVGRWRRPGREIRSMRAAGASDLNALRMRTI